jgi:D-alanyl-lipoteichoic acid acyltransferase DltB (MBOAT superfamily)
VLFNSFAFLLFFPTVTAAYFLAPKWLQTPILLISSFWFYCAWNPVFGVLLVATCAWDWAVAQQIEAAETPQRRRAWLGLSLGMNLLVLATFKYFHLFNETARAGAAAVGLHWPIPETHLPLPIGISFYTLQAMSYVIDVYRGQLPAERSFWRFGLFVTFFPQLVAGPIERATHLLPQFQRPGLPFDPHRLVSGVRLMVWGMMKKVVIADNVAPVCAAVFGAPQDFTGPAYLIALTCFMLQVYCDFSGYSDVAVGSARILGFDLMKNFDQPYGSASIAEFWNRWHISLSSWFRDYLYIPLGGNRVSPARRYGNVMIMFTLSGFWHGASWHFLFWGMLHGAYLVADLATAKARASWAQAMGLTAWPRLHHALGVATTLALVQLSYVLFCCQSMSDVAWVYRHLFSGMQFLTWRGIGAFFHRIQVDGQLILAILLAYPLVEWVEAARRDPVRRAWWTEQVSPAVRWSADWALVVLTLALGRFEDQIFMYFQF